MCFLRIQSIKLFKTELNRGCITGSSFNWQGHVHEQQLPEGQLGTWFQQHANNLPFIKSNTKQSLSGVWKAYVMHTMKGLFTCKKVQKNVYMSGFMKTMITKLYPAKSRQYKN